MRQEELNMFLQQADAICITTNGTVKTNGAVVMGRGVALYAKRCWYGIDKLLGAKVVSMDGKLKVVRLTRKNENVPYLALPRQEAQALLVPVPWHIVSFPVKNHWRDPASLKLIKTSCKQLLDLMDKFSWRKVLLPRPGCGNGQLSWKKQVLPIVREYFGSDDRIVVVHQPETKESNDGKAKSNEEG